MISFVFHYYNFFLTPLALTKLFLSLYEDDNKKRMKVII